MTPTEIVEDYFQKNINIHKVGGYMSIRHGHSMEPHLANYKVTLCPVSLDEWRKRRDVFQVSICTKSNEWRFTYANGEKYLVASNQIQIEDSLNAIMSDEITRLAIREMVNN